MFFIKKLQCFLLSLLIGCDYFSLCSLELPSQELQEYEFIFKSPIYTDYTEQLKTFVETSTLKPPFSLFDPHQAMDKQQAYYMAWMQQLRTQLNQYPLTGASSSSLYQLCYWRYTQPNLLPAYWKWFQQFGAHYSLNLERNPDAVLTQLSTLMQEILQDTRLLSDWEKDSLDPHLAGHLPSFLYQLNNTRFIHTARTVIDSADHLESQVIPEFLGYLKQLKQEGQTHLYINLMLRSSYAKAACHALEDLEKHPNIGNVIQVMTLDKTSNFYWQEAEFGQPEQQAAEFKEQFFSYLFDDSPQSNYKWPSQLDRTEWQSFCQMVLDQVHHLYFDNQPILSNKEREDFIELTYLHLIEEVLQRYQPTYCNISCRHSIDRGPSILALFYAYQRLKEGYWTEEDSQMLVTILFVPPIITHQRGPHTYRIERLQQTFERLLKVYKRD